MKNKMKSGSYFARIDIIGMLCELFSLHEFPLLPYQIFVGKLMITESELLKSVSILRSLNLIKFRDLSKKEILVKVSSETEVEFGSFFQSFNNKLLPNYLLIRVLARRTMKFMGLLCYGRNYIFIEFIKKVLPISILSEYLWDERIDDETRALLLEIYLNIYIDTAPRFPFINRGPDFNEDKDTEAKFTHRVDINVPKLNFFMKKIVANSNFPLSEIFESHETKVSEAETIIIIEKLIKYLTSTLSEELRLVAVRIGLKLFQLDLISANSSIKLKKYFNSLLKEFLDLLPVENIVDNESIHQRLSLKNPNQISLLLSLNKDITRKTYLRSIKFEISLKSKIFSLIEFQVMRRRSKLLRHLSEYLFLERNYTNDEFYFPFVYLSNTDPTNSFPENILTVLLDNFRNLTDFFFRRDILKVYFSLSTQNKDVLNNLQNVESSDELPEGTPKMLKNFNELRFLLERKEIWFDNDILKNRNYNFLKILENLEIITQLVANKGEPIMSMQCLAANIGILDFLIEILRTALYFLENISNWSGSTHFPKLLEILSGIYELILVIIYQNASCQKKAFPYLNLFFDQLKLMNFGQLTLISEIIRNNIELINRVDKQLLERFFECLKIQLNNSFILKQGMKDHSNLSSSLYDDPDEISLESVMDESLILPPKSIKKESNNSNKKSKAKEIIREIEMESNPIHSPKIEKLTKTYSLSTKLRFALNKFVLLFDLLESFLYDRENPISVNCLQVIKYIFESPFKDSFIKKMHWKFAKIVADSLDAMANNKVIRILLMKNVDYKHIANEAYNFGEQNEFRKRSFFLRLLNSLWLSEFHSDCFKDIHFQFKIEMLMNQELNFNQSIENKIVFSASLPFALRVFSFYEDPKPSFFFRYAELFNNFVQKKGEVKLLENERMLFWQFLDYFDLDIKPLRITDLTHLQNINFPSIFYLKPQVQEFIASKESLKNLIEPERLSLVNNIQEYPNFPSLIASLISFLRESMLGDHEITDVHYKLLDLFYSLIPKDQLLFHKLGFTEMIIDSLLIPYAKLNPEYWHWMIGLANELLDGGVLEIQNYIFFKLQNLYSEIFLGNLVWGLQNSKMNSLEEELEAIPSYLNIAPPNFQMSILRFLQLLTENHNKLLQNFLRVQEGSASTLNVVVAVSDFLESKMATLSQSTFPVVLQTLETLNEFVQGPCYQNQFTLCESSLPLILANIFSIPITSGETNTSSTESSIKEEDIYEGLDISSSSKQFLKKLSINSPSLHFMTMKTIKKYCQGQLSISQIGELKLKAATTLESLFEGQYSVFISNQITKEISESLLIENLNDIYSKYINNDIGIEKSEEEQYFIETGYKLYPILKRISSQNYEEEPFYWFYSSNTITIEINREGSIHELSFPKPSYAFHLTNSIKNKFWNRMELSSMRSKLKTLVLKADKTIERLKFQKKYSDMIGKFWIFSMIGRHDKIVKDISLFLAITQNIFFLLTISHAPGQRRFNFTFRDIEEAEDLTFFLLSIFQCLLSGLVFGLTVLKRGPLIRMRTVRKLKSKGLRLGILSFTSSVMNDFSIVYYLLFFLIALLAIAEPLFTSLLLLDIFYRNQLLLYIFRSIWRPRMQIGLLLVTFLIAIYMFTLWAFYFFHKEFDGLCNDLYQCFSLIFDVTFSFNSGIGTFLNLKKPQFLGWTLNGFAIYQFLVWFVSVQLLTQLIAGIIIDTFATQRRELEDKTYEMENYCFICGIDRKSFELRERSSLGFSHHVKEVHSVWNYLFFIAYIKEKEDTEYTGHESYVADAIQNSNFNWFPTNTEEEGELEDEFSIDDEELNKRLDILEETIEALHESKGSLKRSKTFVKKETIYQS